MDTKTLLEALTAATSVADVADAVTAFIEANEGRTDWAPIGGKENNRGPIEVAQDPGRAIVERLTNGIDAVLEAEHERHNGVPECHSPQEAAVAWLNVPVRGLSELTTRQRQQLANSVTVRLLEGEGRENRLIEVRDLGVGLRPDEMKDTILSLNESNKIRKHYLAGTYGQGGSSTFAIGDYTLIASRRPDWPQVGFTIVKFLDLPPEEYKTGHYVYLTLDGDVLTADLSVDEFAGGTLVRHFGYDLDPYPSPLGPNSLYGLLNQVLFDPVVPIWLDNRVHDYRRVIKGSRNALNGAVDEGDENRRGPALDHNVPMFYVDLGDFGRVGFEYWVLEKPTQRNKKPSAAFVDPTRPIVMTINGQNHAEMLVSIIRKEAELPYLAQRLIAHIDCNYLTPGAKRALFASSREDARRGQVRSLIHEELVRLLKSDDELTRLNNAAREEGLRERDETAMEQMRREVARLLRMQGLDLGQATTGAQAGAGEPTSERPQRPHRPRPRPEPLEVQEPPTYIRILWEADEPIGFYSGQRRYVRIETDANSIYHNPDNPAAGRINIVAEGPTIVRGSTPLSGGRMRAIFDAPDTAEVGQPGRIRVELMRPGLASLSDERPTIIHEPPPARAGRQQLSLPPFRAQPVSPADDMWTTLGWPDNVEDVATEAVLQDGILIIYYSTAFPKYANHRARLEQRDPTIADSFTLRYEIWLAAHSLLFHKDEEEQPAAVVEGEEDGGSVLSEAAERKERIRVANLATLFAAREIELGVTAAADE